MSEAQKKRNAAGQRLCRKCAEEREKAVLRTNCEAGNLKRTAEAEAKPLTCAACGEAFSNTRHLKRKQEKDHRAAKDRRWCAEAARISGSQPAVGRRISAAARAREDCRSRRFPTRA
eukprot:9491108-Pyramimonas_sp.AAC.1